jgi:hypothetical protein
MKTNWYLMFLIIYSVSCKEKLPAIKKENIDSQKYIKASDQEEFSKFLQKFVDDSIFQTSRIVFPLSGISDEVPTQERSGDVDWGQYNDGLGPDNIKWDKAEWKYQDVRDKAFDQKEYEIEYQKTDSIIKRIISGRGFGYVYKETFKKIEGKWYLIHFVEINM